MSFAVLLYTTSRYLNSNSGRETSVDLPATAMCWFLPGSSVYSRLSTFPSPSALLQDAYTQRRNGPSGLDSSTLLSRLP